MSYNSHFCPDFHRAVELIGQRWSGAIVREMLAGAQRFTELRHAIPDISDRMLCARLKFSRRRESWSGEYSVRRP